MDRNYIIKITGNTPRGVALRKESVDRNKRAISRIKVCIVALRKESVDRNLVDVARAADRVLSLSARRAWIEITLVQITMSG